jgi:hypothetical protein
VTEEEFNASLNVAVMVAPIATPVAALMGVTAVTVGGVGGGGVMLPEPEPPPPHPAVRTAAVTSHQAKRNRMIKFSLGVMGGEIADSIHHPAETQIVA